MRIVLLTLYLLGIPVIALADEAVPLLVTSQIPVIPPLSVIPQISAETAPAEVASAETPGADVPNNLAIYALSLIGTPYKYGGISPETGFDCSGFVGHVFQQVLGITLPRRSHEINHFGEPIAKDELRPGDLVFYNTLRRTFSHVGIYLGNGLFVHAPRRGGEIRVESMLEKYWRKRFNGARRITSNP